MFKMLIQATRFISSRHRQATVAIVFSILAGAFQTLPVAGLYWMLTHRDALVDQLPILLTLVLGGLAGQLLCRSITQIFMAPLGFQLFAKERLLIGNHLKSAPMGFFNQTRLGDITSAVTTTMSDAEMYLVYGYERVLSGLVNFVMVALFLLIIDWRIGLMAVAVLGLSLIFVNWVNRGAEKIMPQRQQIQRGMVSQVMEFLGGASLLRSFDCETIVSNQLYRSFRGSSQFGFRAEMDMVPAGLGYQLSLKWGSLTLTGFAVGLYLGGFVPLELALLMGVAGFILVVPLEGLVGDLALLRMSTSSLDLIEPIRQAPQMVADPSATGDTEGEGGAAIEFRGVDFAYADRPVLQDVSAVIAPGTTTALIGQSGSGKTTFCNLMMRFWDVDRGEVRVAGRRVQSWEPDELLAQFAVVFQNVYLFSDTVAANIRFGRPEASDAEVREAARRARCLEFIESLPQGFDTVLAEGGASLSGGEKQRISIARAILKDADFVVLDEATSSVDPENERDLQLALDELCAGKTRVVIAHNMATVRGADQILVFDEGRIVQRGVHDELMSEEGIYRDFLRLRERAAGWHITH